MTVRRAPGWFAIGLGNGLADSVAGLGLVASLGVAACGEGGSPAGGSGDTTAADATSVGSAPTSAPTGSPSTTTNPGDASSAMTNDPDSTGSPSDSSAVSDTSSTGDIPGEPAIHWVGRIDDSTPGEWRYQWPNNGFVVRFDGTGLLVTMDDRARYHTVVVDGVVTQRMPTSQGEQQYVVAENLAPGVHVVEVYRQTEGYAGPTRVTSIDIEGELLAPPPVSRRIEIAGDSGAAGYGNLGRPCGDSNESTNAYESYGAIAAREVGGEASIVAMSGASISGNNRLPDNYDLRMQSEGTPWDFSVQADAVVVWLGTNDFLGQNDPPGDVWIADYLEFVRHIRDSHASSFILMVSPAAITGAELATVEGYLQVIVDTRMDEGDRGIAWANLNYEQGQGCANHPSVAQQGVLGTSLADELSLYLDW